MIKYIVICLQNTDNLSNLKYVFNGAKANETVVKNAFKNMMYNSTTNQLTTQGTEVFNTIWNNNNLRNSLFGNIIESAPTPEIAKALSNNNFNDMLKSTNSKIYSFIKAE